MKRQHAARVVSVVLVAAILAAGGGCVAVSVGGPDVSTTDEPGEIRAVGEPRVTEVKPHPSVAMAAADTHPVARIGLAVDITTAQSREQCWERTTVRKQKRIAFGLIPAVAEWGLIPPGADTPSIYGNDDLCELGAVLGCFLYWPWSLVGEPLFGSWECPSHDIGNGFMFGFTHFGNLVGFHRYETYLATGPEPSPKRTPCAAVERKETRAVPGPYRVGLELPEFGFSRVASVPEGETVAGFDLSGVAAPVPLVRGNVSFLPPEGGWLAVRDAERRGWLEAAARECHPVSVVVRQAAPVAVAAAQPRVVERVVEKHIYHDAPAEKAPEGPPYKVERPADGVWRVTILHDRLTAFDVDRDVKPQILQNLKDDFVGRHPDVPREEINAFATYTTADGGRTLVYVGRASSLIPSLESLVYAPETRRGTVTMRLSDGADALRRATEFVRANISVIVCDKNVVLVAGERPPDGARYRMENVNCADGILTVEFEAVE